MLVAAFIGGAGTAWAEETESPGNDFIDITPKQEESSEKALAWLAKSQGRDGSWGSEGGAGNYAMAMTGLAGLAILSAGHSPGRGKYGPNVLRAVKYCLKHQDR